MIDRNMSPEFILLLFASTDGAATANLKCFSLLVLR